MYKGYTGSKYVELPNTFKVNGMTFMCGDGGFILKQSDDGLTALRGNIIRVNGCGVGVDTGLKDKKQNKIYVNDILTISTALYLVVIAAGGAYTAKALAAGGEDATLTSELAATAEVIGNIGKDPVTAAPISGSEELWGHAVSSLQSSISIAEGAITGTLSYISTGALPQVWGAGHFIALKFDSIPEADKVLVGMDPTEGSGFLPLDEDCMAVFKVTNKTKQKLVSIMQKDGDSVRQEYDLSGLTLTAP